MSLGTVLLISLRGGERQENLGRFWLAVYNLRANGGSRNIIAFSYAGCCLYQMEIHLYRVWDQIYSIWIWLHNLTVQLKSSTLDWQERVAVCAVQAGFCISFGMRTLLLLWECVCVDVCVDVSVSGFFCSVSALWWETVVFSEACCCWQAPTLSAMRRTAASQACRGVSHVPVAPLISFTSPPPPCAQ